MDILDKQTDKRIGLPENVLIRFGWISIQKGFLIQDSFGTEKGLRVIYYLLNEIIDKIH